MALQIGSITLPHNAVLAPMSGVTDKPFRQIIRACGGGLVVSEMVASHAVLSEVKDEMRKLRVTAGEESPLSIQLAGWDPQIMAEAARIAEQLGADFIDINVRTTLFPLWITKFNSEPCACRYGIWYLGTYQRRDRLRFIRSNCDDTWDCRG